MTNSVNVSDLAQLAQKLLNDRTQGKDYMLSQVYNMTRQAYETYPEDPVIRQFAFVIEQMMTKRDPSSIITQAEMTSVYNDLVRLSSNTKFKNVLGELLHGLPVTKTASNDDFINHNRVDAVDSTLDTSEYVDQGLVNALNGVFGGNTEEQKLYNNEVATKGAEHVAIELESMGFRPKIEVLGGDANTMVYGAHFDTQEGLVTVAIPLDTSSNKILLPSIFVADNKFEDLTAEKISYFIDKKAMAKDFSVPSTNSILRAINIATGKIRTASDEEFGKELERFNESDTNFHISAPELFSDKQNHPEPKPYIDTTPQVEMPKELAHLAQDFENDLLEAVSTFGKDAIRRGKGVVLAELAAAGFKNSQVRFGSESNNSVIYLAAIHTPKGPVEIEVPVDMQETADNKYAPLLPSCFAYDGLVEDFTPAKLQRFALHGPTPSSMQIVYSTEHSYMTLPELRDEIVKAAAANDYVTCEMVLGTIQDRFEQESYMNAVADYHHLLIVKSSAGKQEYKKCTKEIAAGKGSIEARCGHFGVSMSKVVIGDDGECRLKTAIERERLNPADESGAAISSSKLYWS